MVAQERHSELSLGRVLGTDKEANTEGSDHESPRGGAVAAPSADEPSDDGGHEPNATNPNYVVPHLPPVDLGDARLAVFDQHVFHSPDPSPPQFAALPRMH
jgi:hypothetical protein